MVDHVGIELLDLGLRNALVVVVRRGEDHVDTFALVEAARVERRIEDGGNDCRSQLLTRTEVERQSLIGCCGEQLFEILLREFGLELVVAVMVVNAVCKPYLLEVLFEGFPLGCLTVAFVGRIYGLECAADGQVVLEVLVEHYVASAFCGLAEIVYEQFLVEREFSNPGT